MARQRQRVLERFAVKLRGPQPKPKRLRRTPDYGVPFNTGDLVLVRNREEGVEALFAVSNTVEHAAACHGHSSSLSFGTVETSRLRMS